MVMPNRVVEAQAAAGAGTTVGLRPSSVPAPAAACASATLLGMTTGQFSYALKSKLLGGLCLIIIGTEGDAFGAWAPVPIRGLRPSGTCQFRLWVRSMRWPLPFLRPAAFPPRSPPPACRPALFEASSVLCSRPTPPTFRSGFGSSPSRTDPGPPERLRAAGGLPGSDTILDGSNWSQTPVERRSLA